MAGATSKCRNQTWGLGVRRHLPSRAAFASNGHVLQIPPLPPGDAGEEESAQVNHLALLS